MPNYKARIRKDGFTLLEVVLVLVFISIFAVVAVARQPATDATLQAQADILKSHIRYAHARAINTTQVWGIEFDTSEPNALYHLYRIAPIEENRRVLPGELDIDVDLHLKGITIGIESVALSFDSWGRPYVDGDLITDGPLEIPLSKDNQSRSVFIEKNTGFVQ